jgi:hypothetical protein
MISPRTRTPGGFVSTISSQTTYDISIGEYSGGTLSFFASDGFTDGIVLGIASALNNAQWPDGFALNLSFRKAQVQETDSTGSLTSTPPAFS